MPLNVSVFLSIQLALNSKRRGERRDQQKNRTTNKPWPITYLEYNRNSEDCTLNSAITGPNRSEIVEIQPRGGCKWIYFGFGWLFRRFPDILVLLLQQTFLRFFGLFLLPGAFLLPFLERCS